MQLFGDTGNNTKQLTSLSQHPICRDDEIHAFPFEPEASSVSAPPCKVGGHGRQDSDYDGLFFGGPSQLTSIW